jgi:ubiquinone/menaquinone biosynthesis C-methylase UbiE
MKDDARHTQLNEAKWDKWAESSDGGGWVHRYLRDAQSKVIALLGVKEDMRFLDVGCGTGWAVGEVAKSVNNKGLFYGVDLSAKMIEKAKENFSGRENLHFIKANAESIPLDDGFFDIIICTNSFHHYLHPDRAVSEFYRLLKKGGKVYVMDATTDVWYAKIVDWIFRLFEAEHVKHHNTREYQQLFHDSGLRHVVSKKVKGNNKVHIGEK